jgi:peptidoglycan/LPS O-acetylase OafA/YrhL
MFSQVSLIRLALENAAARHLGLVSYSIYLWQMPIIQELQEHGWTVGLPLLAAIVVAVATISYLAIERPFLGWFRAGQTEPSSPSARSMRASPKRFGLLDAGLRK